MQHAQVNLSKVDFTDADLAKISAIQPHLVCAFGPLAFFEKKGLGEQMKKAFPNSTVIGCSCVGEISSKGESVKSLVVSGVQFGKDPQIKSTSTVCANMDESFNCGKKIATDLNSQKLKFLFVIGPGTNFNGSQLIEGIKSVVSKDVIITGGLAGDGAQFTKTLMILNDKVADNQVVAFGIYTDDVHVGFGSMGGWKPFGPPRTVSKAKNNILFEIDGEPALQIYKRYLGKQAEQLPTSGLLYPFAILDKQNDETGIIRTILGINEADNSVTLAGDVEEGQILRLMHADNNGLIEGAQGAAKNALHNMHSGKNNFAILISCIGRKLVMGSVVDEEIIACKEAFGKETLVTGFYSHGEIAPTGEILNCKLHNQTMTITFLSDK